MSMNPNCTACGSPVHGSKVGSSFNGYCIKRGCPEDRRLWTWKNWKVTTNA